MENKKYLKSLREAFPSIYKKSLDELEKELKEFQDFLTDPSSSTGGSDWHYENALRDAINQKTNGKRTKV